MTRNTWGLAAAAVLAAVAVIGGVVALAGADHTTQDARAAPANTAQVKQGKLSAVVSQNGILTYRARPDGSPFSVTNQARGTYTELPEVGDKVDCGGVLYRVDDKPVLLLCGAVPAYRALQVGDAGQDVRQLNRNLRVRGADDAFSAETEHALEVLQRRRGVDVTGALASGDAVFLPEAARIARVSGQPGAPARPGAPVLSVTSDTLHVQVDLDPSQQGQVKRGDRAQITLPGNTIATGKVVGFGRIAQPPPARTASPLTRPSPPPSASSTRARPAGSTEPRSGWTSSRRAWRAR